MIFWSMLMERSVQDQAVLASLTVAMHCGRRSYSLIQTGYGRTDATRNKLVAAFIKQAKSDDDVLVMLDCDHIHPMDIVERLASHNVEVVGALAFRRGAPYDPCFFVRLDDGQLATPAEFGGLHRGTIVGTGAIAIRRSVFAKLDAAGFPYPYFRYEYRDGTDVLPSEDMYFGRICEQAGIPHYCDTDFVTPHLIAAQVDATSWQDWRQVNSADVKYTEVNVGA